MSLSNIIDGTKKDLARYARAYASARGQLSLLSAYETTQALLDALRPTSKSSHKGALVALLVEQAQKTGAPLWQALLVTTFAPLLVRLRVRSQRSDVTEDDQDQAVLAAFLEAVRQVPPGEHAAMGLRWKTQGLLFAATRADRLGPETEAFDDHAHGPTAHAFEERESARAAAAEIMELLEARGATEALDVLLCTEALDEPLREYVERTCPKRAQHAREYGRLTRERQRATQAVLQHFARSHRAA